jgi:glycosyltransferase involved in cell wall biosynthesis
LKILFAADVSIARVGSGAERVLYEQTTRLAAAGHDVHLITPWMSDIHKKEVEEISGVTEWRYPGDKRYPVRFVAGTFKNAGRLFQQLNQDLRFDSLFFHQPLTACAVMSSAKKSTAKKLYTCHSLWHEEYLSRTMMASGFSRRFAVMVQALIRKKMEKRVLKDSDRIIVLSAYTEEKLLRCHGLPSDAISIVPGGVDLTLFSPDGDQQTIRKRLGLPVNRIVLFTLRNLEPRMGLAELLNAIKEVIQQLPEVCLVIGGEGPLRKGLIEQVERTGLNSHVFFTGFIDESDLPDYYRMADLFILPTRALEGFGLVTLEAMASGTPVLGTPVGGTREILNAFDGGFLFEDISAESMARLIKQECKRLLKDPVAAKLLRQKVRTFVEANYSWERHVNALMALVGDLNG